jgi:hypothetical protein
LRYNLFSDDLDEGDLLSVGHVEYDMLYQNPSEASSQLEYLARAVDEKANRGHHSHQPLQVWALILSLNRRTTIITSKASV